VILQKAVLSAEVAAAEAAVSDDALGRLPALLCVAADTLRGHDCGRVKDEKGRRFSFDGLPARFKTSFERDVCKSLGKDGARRRVWGEKDSM